MSISPTGDGLYILIASDYVPHHDWMTFLCWYSLSKNLPDAKVAIACHRRLMTYRLFDWPRKCRVPLDLHKPDEDQVKLALESGLVGTPLLVLEPWTVALRDLEEGNFPVNLLEPGKYLNVPAPGLSCEAQADDSCAFVTYPNGWGKFVTASWINKRSHPFTGDQRYGYGSLTANEMRLGRLWNAVTPLYQTVSRG